MPNQREEWRLLKIGVNESLLLNRRLEGKGCPKIGRISRSGEKDV